MTNKSMEKIYDMACNQLDQTRSSYAVLESLKDGFNDGLIFKIQCEMDESYEEAKVLVTMLEDELPNRGSN
jgi:23S rRNA C2498 (ribose-2'-O)-methylase RlmM